jgi:hypothetical protein
MLDATRSINKLTLNRLDNAHLLASGAMASLWQIEPEEVEARLASANGSKVASIGDTNSSALLRAGEYILYGPSQWLHPEHEDNPLLVGQILDIADYRDIIHCEISEILMKRTLGHAPSPTEQFVLIRRMPFFHRRDFVKDARDYPMVASSLREVQKSSVCHWHAVEHIKSIAFVFHIEDINDGRYSCAGIKNAFIIRSTAPMYLAQPSTPLDKADFDPFLSPFGQCESYSKRMWNSIAP